MRQTEHYAGEEPKGSSSLFGENMRITVKLGGFLRDKVPGHREGLLELELNPGSHITDAIKAMGLKKEDVKLVMKNHRAVLNVDEELRDGDRLGLFPPQLAYNTFVALSFRSRLETKD